MISTNGAIEFAVLVVATLTLFIAVAQLRKSARSIADQTEIARAQLLMELDNQFESSRLQRSRAMAGALLKTLAATNGSSKVTTEFSRFLDSLWDHFSKDEQLGEDDARIFEALRSEWKEGWPDDEITPSGSYKTLMAILGWTENIAHLTDKNLLPKNDVFDIYGPVMTRTLELFQGHINSRRTLGNNSQFMRNTTMLGEEFRRKSYGVLEPKTRSTGISDFS